jgi:hypothetical protein
MSQQSKLPKKTKSKNVLGYVVVDESADNVTSKVGEKHGDLIVAQNLYGKKYWKKKPVYKVEPPYITDPKMIQMTIYGKDTTVDHEDARFKQLSERQKICLKRIRSCYRKFAEIGIIVFEAFLRIYDDKFNDMYVLENIDEKYPELMRDQIPHIIVIFHLNKNKVQIVDDMVYVHHSFIYGNVKVNFLCHIVELYKKHKVLIEWNGDSGSSIKLMLT